MADNVQAAPAAAPSAAPAPSAPAAAPSRASAPVSTPVAPSHQGGYVDPYEDSSADSIFGDLRQQMGLDADDTQEMDSFTSNVHEGTEEDLLGMDDSEVEQGTQEESIGETADETLEESAEPQFEVDYDYEGKVGNEDVKFKIKSKEQLDNIISRAVHYNKLVDSYKTLKKDHDTYKQSHEQIAHMDKVIEENPLGFAESIIEDLPEEQVKEWLLNLASTYGKPAQEREIDKKLRQAELVQQKLDRIEQERELLNQQRKQAALEADKNTVRSWASGILSKAKSRIPQEYHAIVEQQLQYALKDGAAMRRENKDVSIQTLNTIFQRNMQPYMGIIGGGKSKENEQKVASEVGKAIQGKKEQALQRVQSIASKAQPNAQQKTRMQSASEASDVGGMFDEIIRGVNQGRIRMIP